MRFSLTGRVGAMAVRSRGVVLSLLYWSLRRLLELVVLRRRSEREKEIEILLLRHQLRVLERVGFVNSIPLQIRGIEEARQSLRTPRVPLNRARSSNGPRRLGRAYRPGIATPTW